ncbi:MAG: alpha-galactosidase [Clostridia bacterium]|nr:alpha-galactosidase [Clostridia bacterium]
MSRAGGICRGTGSVSYKKGKYSFAYADENSRPEELKRGASLCLGGSSAPLLSGITASACLVMRLSGTGDPSAREELSAGLTGDCGPSKACFAGEGLRVSLTVRQRGRAFALIADGKVGFSDMRPHGTHPDPSRGFCFGFALPHTGNMLSMYMGCSYWQRPAFGDSPEGRTQSLLLRRPDGGYLFLMTAAEDMYKTEIFPTDGGRVLLAAHSNTVCSSISECVLVGAAGDDPYELPQIAAAFGLSVMRKKGRLRSERKYPPVLDYLGWCSWDAFHMDVSEDGLLRKAEEFRDRGIPVRWMLLDDMWSEVKGNDLRTMHSRELWNWEADPARFPGGLAGAVGRLKSTYGMKVGIWHPVSGYWSGIDPESPLAKNKKGLLEYTIPRPGGGQPVLMHSFVPRAMRRYYSELYSFYRKSGADFVKADNQGSLERFSYLRGGIGRTAREFHSAIERAAGDCFGGALINCMGMPVENFWNRESAVCRFSGDFKPENREWFSNHLLQCSFNSFSQGALYTGDWDMFWSDDGQGVRNALLRALSGGPVYLSDELGRSVREVIMPAVLSDGRIIRLPDPALPVFRCLFDDPRTSGRPYAVFNRCGEYGLLALFDLDSGGRDVRGSFSASDIRGFCGREGDCYVYDWFGKSARLIRRGESIDVTLRGPDGFAYYVFAPKKDGPTVLGLEDKYVMPGTFRETRDGIRMLDGGRLLVCSCTPVEGAEKLGEYLYGMSVSAGQTADIGRPSGDQ